MKKQAFSQLEGLISHETGLRLAALAATVPKDQAIVEIGSYKGKSSCYLAKGAQLGKGAHVWCVEAWDTPGNVTGRFGFAEPSTRQAFDAQVKSVGLTSQITPVRGMSVAVAPTWDGRPIGMLYIDATHHYKEVKEDFLAWSLWIPAGGIVVFDDAHHTKPCNRGVGQFVDELRAGNEWVDWDLDTTPIAICRRAS